LFDELKLKVPKNIYKYIAKGNNTNSLAPDSLAILHFTTSRIIDTTMKNSTAVTAINEKQ
jgi:hypothetical protein